MKIRIEHLQRAESRGDLAPGQAETLWQALNEQLADEPSFKLRYIFYYFGAMLMLLPFTIIIGPALLNMDEKGLCFVATIMTIGMFVLGVWLKRRGWQTPAGIFGCVAIALVPLVAFLGLKAVGVQFEGNYRDFHQIIDGRWVFIELLTLAGAAFALWCIREPFMVLPVAVILWYMGMDLAEGIASLHDDFSFGVARWYTTAFGLMVLASAYAIERRTYQTLRDYSFWLWIFGTMSFWGALSASDAAIEWQAALYGVINIGMIIVGGLVGRRVLAVFGGLGSAGYLGHLSYKVFADSILFPFIVMGIGVVLIWIAMQWPKTEAWFAAMRKSISDNPTSAG